jgi:hypothetical protein
MHCVLDEARPNEDGQAVVDCFDVESQLQHIDTRPSGEVSYVRRVAGAVVFARSRG